MKHTVRNTVSNTRDLNHTRRNLRHKKHGIHTKWMVAIGFIDLSRACRL